MCFFILNNISNLKTEFRGVQSIIFISDVKRFSIRYENPSRFLKNKKREKYIVCLWIWFRYQCVLFINTKYDWLNWFEISIHLHIGTRTNWTYKILDSHEIDSRMHKHRLNNVYETIYSILTITSRSLRFLCPLNFNICLDTIKACDAQAFVPQNLDWKICVNNIM